MRLTIVGCSGSYPGPDSPSSCYLLEAEEQGRTWRIVLDLGSGSLGALQRYVDPLDLDAVLLSHLHPDHCMDLTGYYVLRRYHPGGTRPPIPVWGPEGTAERLARAYDLPIDPGMTAEFDFRVWEGSITVGPFDVEPVAVVHPVPAYGLRVSADGVTLGYSGDTGPCDGLEAIAKETDLFLAEASFRSGDHNPEGIHLTGTDCGMAAARAGAKRLMVTHVPPWFDREQAVAEARTAYDGPIEIARQGAVHDL